MRFEYPLSLEIISQLTKAINRSFFNIFSSYPLCGSQFVNFLVSIKPL